MKLLYSLLYSACLLFAAPYFLIVGLVRGKYLGSIRQRFGFVPVRSSIGSIWVHAVSVGELLAARPLIARLNSQFPRYSVFVSTTTATAQTIAQKTYPGQSFYFPFDFSWSIRRVLNNLNSEIVLVLETEIWPNLLWECGRRKIPVVLVNGRISDRSFQRYRAVRSLLPAFDLCLMQSEKDTERMRELALFGENVITTGNVKFDFSPAPLSDSLRELLLQWKADALLLIAGSTMEGEEQLILEWYAILKQRIAMKLLVAPRHPERFSRVVSIIRDRRFSYSLRSQNRHEHTDVMVLDTVGELAACYEIADLVLVGGTLTSAGGGHNPIEPAFHGKAIVAGTNYNNFAAVFEEFIRRDAIVVASDVHTAIDSLAADAPRRSVLGQNARRLVTDNAGAADRTVQHVGRFLRSNAVTPLAGARG